jgi:2-C-methyl-D-erythritol 4-phosphate cytidylyltransferase / 2-C-methyl-D-erythritol 2,4-cyclodiphosphate synthase
MSHVDRTPRFWAIVPAAGRGERFGSQVSAAGRKQYAALAGATVIEWSLRPLLSHALIEAVAVPVSKDDDHWPLISARIGAYSTRWADKIVACDGGSSRQESVLRGLIALGSRAAEDDWVLVHDAARPCLPDADVASLLRELGSMKAESRAQGAILALPVADTVKRLSADGSVATVDRAGLWRALTPQAFRYSALKRALTRAVQSGEGVTDEAQAMERIGVACKLVAASALNIKITVAQDIAVAERTLNLQRGSGMRIGQGFDVHAFTDGDHVVLGGVRIPHTRGILAHSDGDVVIHALCDAILGALSQGDIGRHFPDSDPGLRGADSRRFLRDVGGLMRAAGFRLGNVDITVAAQAPRIAAHGPAMIRNLSEDLDLPADRINIKATTTERLGFIGREEGLAASAVVLLEAAGTA